MGLNCEVGTWSRPTSSEDNSSFRHNWRISLILYEWTLFNLRQMTPDLLCRHVGMFSMVAINIPHYTVSSVFCFFFGIAGIAQWHSAGLRARWSGLRDPAEAGNFSLHHRVQTGSGAHPAPYPVGTRSSFPGDKAAGAWNWPLTSI
jgi:hypothetical protein